MNKQTCGLLTGALILAAVLLLSCGGGGGGLVLGQVSTALELIGPLVGEEDLNKVALIAELQTPEGDLVQRLTLTNQLPGFLENRQIEFDFPDVPAGTYKVVVSSIIAGVQNALYTEPIVITGQENGALDVSGETSLTGEGPYAVIAGIISYEGTVPEAPIELFIGLVPEDSDIPLREGDQVIGVREGLINYTILGVAEGTYSIILYGEDTQTGALSIYGQYEGLFDVTAADAAAERQWADVDFNADFQPIEIT